MTKTNERLRIFNREKQQDIEAKVSDDSYSSWSKNAYTVIFQDEHIIAVNKS